MEKIKYSIALILITSSILSQSNDGISIKLIKMEKIADSLVELCEFEKPIEIYKELVNLKPDN